MNESDRSRHIWDLAEKVACTYRRDGVINRIGEKDLPPRSSILQVLDRLLTLVFPGYHGEPVPRDADLQVFAASHLGHLYSEITAVLVPTLRFSRRHGCTGTGLWGDATNPTDADVAALAARLTSEYLDHLPAIRELLRDDVQAAYDGDPAASSTDEVILCYPGVLAIAVHRVAHPLHRLGVPLMPRIMSEWAHQQTGVDIHPGASIGRGFFVDHGTGTVIGETAILGERVKLYQGVTIGALSFQRNADGSLAKGGKRHPTVEDQVTVYAGATILGGETVIGRGAIIGGGTWITASVAAGARVIGS